MLVHLAEHLHLVDLLVHALDRDKILHIITSHSLSLAVDTKTLHHPKVLLLTSWLSFLSVWCLLILHLIFQIIENTIKIYRVKFNWNL